MDLTLQVMVRSLFGFGEAFIAVPLWALRISIEEGSAVCGPVVHHHRRRCGVRSTFARCYRDTFCPPAWLRWWGCWYAGLWVPQVTHWYLLSLPTVIPAIFIGRPINHCLRGDSFLKHVHAGRVCVGAGLLMLTIRRT